MSTRKIRISVELNIAGHHIPDEYEDLPEGWDDWPEQKRRKHLDDTAMDYLGNHASCAGTVVEIRELEP